MRKLKFRAWSEEQNKFIQGYPLGEDQKNGFTVCGISEDGEQETEDDGLVLMQWTGLKDKNGKEIFEGDIVLLNRSSWLSGNFQAEGTIEWYYHKWQWKRLPKYDGDENNGIFPTCDIWSTVTWLEVIGNIYENKNLLQ